MQIWMAWALAFFLCIATPAQAMSASKALANPLATGLDTSYYPINNTDPDGLESPPPGYRYGGPHGMERANAVPVTGQEIHFYIMTLGVAGGAYEGYFTARAIYAAGAYGMSRLPGFALDPKKVDMKGTTPASQQIMRSAARRGGEINPMLERGEAYVNTGSSGFKFGPDASRVEIMEEVVHLMAKRLGRPYEGKEGEIFAKEFLMRFRKTFGHNADDMRVLQETLNVYTTGDKNKKYVK